jgi:hypothetical protein
MHPLSSIHLHQLGGAIDRVNAGSTALTHRGHPFVLNVISTWSDPDADTRQRAWAKDTAAAITRSPAQYANYLFDPTPDKVRPTYSGEVYARLVSLEHRFDPANPFRLNLNIALLRGTEWLGNRATRLPRPGVGVYGWQGTVTYRSDRNPVRTSSEKSCGCSQAAKCPPLPTLL